MDSQSDGVFVPRPAYPTMTPTRSHRVGNHAQERQAVDPAHSQLIGPAHRSADRARSCGSAPELKVAAPKRGTH